MQDQSHIDAVIAGQAGRSPAATAIIDSAGSTTFAQYDAHITAAAGLLKTAGAQPGDRVLIVAENCLATAVFIFAASRAGAIAVPVNARMTAPEIARVVDHAQPRCIVYTSACSAEAAIHAADASAQDIGFGPFHMTQLDPAPLDADTADVAVILYTTGTTGAPKGVMLTHANLLFAGNLSMNLRGMTAGDHVYGVLPLTHIFGLASVLLACAISGATLQLETRFTPAKLHAALLGGATVFPAVPQMHALLMQYAADQGLTRLEGAKLRYVSSGAAPLDPAWKAKAEGFYGLPLQNGYGMTESTAGVSGTRNTIGSPDTSAGPPLPGIEVRIDAAPGADAGEVLTRGAHVMKGYFRAPDLTAQTVQDGWLRTGDLGKLDAAGNLHIVGRAKELIIRGGFNVYPPEVEAALNDHPDVIQCAVIGAKNAVGDEDILAFVQCRDPLAFDTAALSHFAAARLSGYKRPTRIFAVDALPAAPTGKILKHKLLDAFADRLNQKD
ncbi:class I adenylate-forming enzyme family protein [Loktanella salsilacus]|jgi:acyl-CoA synthetase (AMP-forming)/AMP-acid ligase II|uniref:Acyl-CoA synthetase (AMP-forming)/AMP-acid ligase II n=1 Tax=Loktanella salsilacus TaxID=195913 RepID=A0A1I4GDK1_9RHOB|nr:AMP-binding protein [Loktanella salsilacus]SFL27939.1 Acyl-CoA synthetase (AMP-forming)/AMP-acid ligase II [Loktanella salsilacus]